MDSSAWIALAGLSVVIFVQIGLTAFIMGQLFQRVADLEKNAPDIASLIRGVAKLESAVDGLTARFDDTLGWMTRIEGYQPPPSGTATRGRRKS